MSQQVLDRLSGSLQLQPGAAIPGNLRSSRRDWARLLAPGLPAEVLPGRLGLVFGLCAHAHRLCAGLSLAAALATPGERIALAPAQAQVLQRETLREHLRRILLDWPRLLLKPGMGAQSFQLQARRALLSCPLLLQDAIDLPPEQWRAPTLAWMERELLGLSAPSFLALWQHRPQACLELWSQEGEGFLPQLFMQLRELADQPWAGARPLHPQASEADLLWLAQAMGGQPGFCMAPQWRGVCAETGPWTRWRLGAAEQGLSSLWLRLGARLVECLRLALTEDGEHGAAYLDAGALCLAPGQGLAWVEMARGLLVHRIELEAGPQGGYSLESRVRSCQVLAPTEWNFHPEGAVASGLAALPSNLTPRVCQASHLLMNAYDPCVSYDLVDSSPMRQALSPNLAGDCHA
ncbi:hydrogenase formation protein [Paucibacter sp. KBW04]|uniref:hydrogenase formation protein n=1 Tax=Paucibacter sp. KBW04 TaxID=2153361 RepID=UPI000F567A76|nr:hydrogenase formation protein [Paucibacter sp. KBW04]RQO56279.1 hydrogenase formation protein [Paucibacter sp. KBW04]